MSQPYGPTDPRHHQPAHGPHPGGHGPLQAPPGYPGYQQQGYGPPHGHYPPGYDPFGGQQPRKKSPLPWVLAGIASLVVFGGGTVLLLVLLTGGSPESTAEELATAFNTRDTERVLELACADMHEELRRDAIDDIDPGARIEVDRVEQRGGTAVVYYTKYLDGEQQDYPMEVRLVERGGEWLLCD